MIYLDETFNPVALEGCSIVVFRSQMNLADTTNILKSGFQSAIKRSEVATRLTEVLGMTVECSDKGYDLSENDVVVVAQYLGPRRAPYSQFVFSKARVVE